MEEIIERKKAILFSKKGRLAAEKIVEDGYQDYCEIQNMDVVNTFSKRKKGSVYVDYQGHRNRLAREKLRQKYYASKNI